MKQNEQTIIYSLDNLSTVAQHIKTLLPKYQVFTFTGSLGAGKTTLVREILQLCGIHDYIVSPTFTYVNIYHNNNEQTFYHFDCYRITTLDNFLAAGFDEYLYQPNSWTFIEWPEPVMPILDHAVCHITIDYLPELDKRILKIR